VLDLFIRHINKQQLFTKNDKLLVAVSGGIDSMALCALLLKANYQFSIVHCNFMLRGSESEEDELFISAYCKKNNVLLFNRAFNTKHYAETKKISIQMAARELRYAYFDELLKNHSFDYLLTAHHLNDSIETFFINLSRGSGINGLKGISEKQNSIVRPLLPFTKDEILNYAEKNSINYRTDSSNTEEKYLRNYLRLNIIPQFKNLNPSFEKTMEKELELMQQYHSIIQSHFLSEIKQAVSKTPTGITIKIETILNCKTPELLLFEILNEYGFNSKLISSINESLNGISGKHFSSEEYELLKDRDFLIVNKKVTLSKEEIIIEKDTSEILNPLHLKFNHVTDFVIENNTEVAYIDESKLQYPLILRPWKRGDKFKPLGMAGFKKLSDLFVDKKLNNFEKEYVRVLENGNNEIIWVVNVRMDDRFKITANTKQILRIEYLGGK